MLHLYMCLANYCLHNHSNLEFNVETFPSYDNYFSLKGVNPKAECQMISHWLLCLAKTPQKHYGFLLQQSSGGINYRHRSLVKRQ
jgi:hypothetical protein